MYFSIKAPPSPPQNLRTPNVTSRSVTLDWEIPAHNGGSEITGKISHHIPLDFNLLSQIILRYLNVLLIGYCVEKRSSTASSWSKVVTLDAHCLQYTVDNLKEKCEYVFRVSAENEAGLGAAAVTENIALKTHASKWGINII